MIQLTLIHILNRPVPNQHIFDGKIIPGPSSMFQLCDIIDPEITVLIRNKEYIKSHSTVSRLSLHGYKYSQIKIEIRWILLSMRF